MINLHHSVGHLGYLINILIKNYARDHPIIIYVQFVLIRFIVNVKQFFIPLLIGFNTKAMSCGCHHLEFMINTKTNLWQNTIQRFQPSLLSNSSVDYIVTILKQFFGFLIHKKIDFFTGSSSDYSCLAVWVQSHVQFLRIFLSFSSCG